MKQLELAQFIYLCPSYFLIFNFSFKLLDLVYISVQGFFPCQIIYIIILSFFLSSSDVLYIFPPFLF